MLKVHDYAFALGLFWAAFLAGAAESCVRGEELSTNAPEVEQPSAPTAAAPVNVSSLEKPKDLKEPAASYWDAAVKGSPEAACRLAASYANATNGAPQNNNLAEFWCRHSAEEKCPLAEAFLGEMYENGLLGHPIDLVQAREWYARGARAGNPSSQLHLSEMLYAGQGGDENDQEAFRWLLLAADDAYGPAAYHIAAIYQDGTTDVPKNPSLAYLWSLLAISFGDLGSDDARKNDDIEEDGEFVLSPADVVRLKHRRDELLSYGGRFGVALIDDGPEETVTVPSEGTGGNLATDDDAIKVMVHFEGKDSHCFLVDTGSSFSLVSAELAGKLGLTEVGPFAMPGNLSNSSSTRILTANGQIFGAQFKNLRFVETKSLDLYKGFGVEGVLGGNFIRLIRLKVDMSKNLISFTLPQAIKGGGIPLTFSAGEPHVQVTIESPGHPSIAVSALLDSGNDGSMIMNGEFNREHPFEELIQGTAVQRAMEMFESIRSIKTGRIYSLGIGPFSVPKPVLDYDSVGTDPLNIGMSVLRKFSVLFDYQNARLYLEPRDIDVPEPTVVYKGMCFWQEKNGDIAFVEPDGPAAKAGFKTGDMLETIDGHSLQGMGWLDVNALFTSGTHAITVKRDGQNKTLALVLGPGI
jgi:predicted aspartyl protease